jgi:acyl carrier protein
MKNNIKVRIQETLAIVFPSVEGEFKEEWGPNEVEGWDSMAHLNLVMAISEEFEIEFGFEEVMEIATVGDIIGILERKEIQ